MQSVSELQSWHWLALGIFILVIEVLGAGGFLLGIGIGALLVSLLMVFLPEMSWQWQLLLFGALSVLATLVYWKRFRHFNQATSDPQLNDRTARLVGTRTELIEAIELGRGRIQVADAMWSVVADDDMPKGTKVEVVSAEGMTLKVRRLDG